MRRALQQQKTFQQLLDRATDFELCNGAFTLIVDRRRKNIDVSKWTETERVIVLVWHAYGIIGNGGFQYLFEGRFTGDPTFAVTASAFRRIGCTEAAKAFDEALALFPGKRPPTNIEARLEIYGAVPEHRRDGIDQKFWNAWDVVPSKLAAFIRANARALELRLSAV